MVLKVMELILIITQESTEICRLSMARKRYNYIYCWVVFRLVIFSSKLSTCLIIQLTEIPPNH